ncbi:AlbA family DNA-binding domain-containing protein [Agrobacterium cavarae]|uniref:AlbA family DNA-binding domain-containing protein n=1 Tax=Agrobacterium cavarae TaxID=2528239 RepID=UPI002FD9D3C1
MNYDFDPFDKPFDSITAEDLAILKTVAEGWYVEYKREVPNASSISKSVTAFSNTYGGWLFYGIDELSKENAVAGSFPGVPLDEADAFLQRIRQSVAANAQPTPFFRVRAITGPAPLIDLEDGRCIIIAQIPWGPEAPYIHKSGVIFRRVGDSSEPRPENDRYMLDQLWKRSEKITERYENWIDEELEISEAERNLPFLQIFVIRDFWRDHPPIKPLSLKKVREILADKGPYTLPFDKVYETRREYVCRQTTVDDPERMSLTWKLSRGLNSELIIPLPNYNVRGVGEALRHFDGYSHIERFLKICGDQNYKDPKIIDVNMILLLLLGFCRTLVSLSDEIGWEGDFHAKLKFRGLWRTISFFDMKEFLDDFEAYGLPLMLRDEVVVSAGKDFQSYIHLRRPDVDAPIIMRGTQIATDLWFNIALALGAPMLDDATEGKADSFLDMGQRAIDVQKKRLERSINALG